MSGAAPKPVRFGDLGLRLLSGLALAAIALGDLWLGGYWLGGLAGLAAALMLWELHRIVTGDPRWVAPAGLALGVAAAAAVLAASVSGLPAAATVIAAGMIAAMLLTARHERVWLAAGLVWIALAMCFLSLLRDSELRGFPVVLWLVLAVIAADVGGYFVGRTVGGPKLWPAVSPGKTWSGALGGLGLAVVVGLGYGQASGWSLPRTGVLSAGVAIASQAGDLLESAVKRRFGAKDASRLIPGHGGLLDRLDGVMGALWFFALYDLAGGSFGA